ncbi:MAG TPA: dihydroxyacetone kinase subunit DhaK [Candidatus Limnocylindrales bacterium]
MTGPRMQKILNDPEPFVDEMLDGILAAHPDRLRRPSPRAIVRADAPVAGKVAIATGGGSGHLPVFMGYVGRGLIDGAAIGNVFASPSSEDMLDVTRAVHAGRGVLYVYGNYGGDRLNFDLAAELAADDGIEVRTILGADDVASAPPERASARRGIAGIFFLYKVAGAAAAAGASLDEVVVVTERAAATTRTMGVALSPCTIPAAGVPTFELPVGEMEIGMGIHGEPGVRRGPLETADRIADELTRTILADLPYARGDVVGVLVNGLGATPREELYILYRSVARILDREGISVHRVWVGEFATSLEMAGASLTLIRLDDELRALVDAPAETPFFVQA